nr:NADH-quinone oxidoreductase subunit L [Virgisporangium aurantiacum]
MLAAFVGFLLRSRRAAAALAIGAASVSLVAAIGLAVRFENPFVDAYRAADFAGLSVDFGVRVNGPATLMAVTVGVVALAVQVYSVAYLHDDDRYAPYAAQVSLFTAAMMTVVVAPDLIQLLIGWEVMGICSYLLIAHDRRLPEAPGAAVKAFLVTRVGDVGFLLGIAVLGYHAGSFRIDVVLAHDYHPRDLTLATLLLLAGVAGKSAQFPLHTWLPDAMAGPTPISALIHAATMVAAGVYVVAQLFPLFEGSDTALTVLAVMAAITMLLGALAALAQTDIKRVLAWSTVSQLGYMTGALAVHAPGTALFHLFTHAAFKALLFLAAGAVIHAVGSNLIAVTGGLRGTMPATFLATTAGLAALAGLPPFSGFFSKEAVLASAAHEGGGAGWLVYGAGAVTVLLTGWYAARLWLRVFLGAPRTDAARNAHEPPGAMRWPVLLLAVPATLLGFAALSDGFVDRLGPGTEEVGHFGAALAVPLLLALAGAGLAALMWRRTDAVPNAPASAGAGPGASEAPPSLVAPVAPLPALLSPGDAGARADPADLLPARDTLAAAFYLDAVQDALVTRPVLALARWVKRGDEAVVDGAVNGSGATAVRAGGLLALMHRASVPRAAGAALAGAVLLGLVAAVLEWTR